jgi:hypothetical protein
MQKSKEIRLLNSKVLSTSCAGRHERRWVCGARMSWQMREEAEKKNVVDLEA